MQSLSETKHDEAMPILVHKTKYLIDSETASQLKNGIIPQSLQNRITQTQGKEFCFEFCRQRRLMKRICDQIDAGVQPESIRTLIESGNVPADILYKLYHHKLLGKAEKLRKENLLTDDIVETIREKVLTEEIVEPLSHAYLVEMAKYLYEHHEINMETFRGIKSRTIDPVYIQIIRRHYRHMTHMEELQEKHSVPKVEGMPEPAAEDERLEAKMIQESTLSTLREAMRWLSAEDAELIHQIYMDETPLTRLAAKYGVGESTIRYRRDRILKKLRFIFENILHCSKTNLFE